VESLRGVVFKFYSCGSSDTKHRVEQSGITRRSKNLITFKRNKVEGFIFQFIQRFEALPLHYGVSGEDTGRKSSDLKKHL
jgi:hypothetical protein